MSTTHEDHHYSVSMRSGDLAVVGCLRALSQHCQKTGNARIPWGGTSREEWKRKGKVVTFHFSEPGYREDLIREAARLLPSALYSIVEQKDDDPAVPAGRV